MGTLEEAVKLAIAVYDDYRDKGLSKDETRSKAVAEMVERYRDVELVRCTSVVKGQAHGE